MIGIFRLGDEFVAVSGWCSHERASLLRGEVVGEEIQCPIHGARFSLRTGRQRSLPAVRPIASYPVRVEEGVILVDVEGGRT